jgi:hypothetical protein
MDSNCGSDLTNDTFLRTCFLRIFIDPLNFDSDKANWLNVFYEYMRMHQFTKLLMLLCAPTNADGSIIMFVYASVSYLLTMTCQF